MEPGQDVVSGGGRFHGKGGTKVSYDGMGMENSSGNNSYQLNSASVEEMVISTSGISADTNADGMVMNVVPKEGGNTFRTISPACSPTRAWRATNLTDELRTRGLTTANKTIKLFDESLSVGGPIKRDKLWFFVGAAELGCGAQPGRDLLEQDAERPPDSARRGVQGGAVDARGWIVLKTISGRLEWYDSILARVTWQASAKNKVNVTYDEQRACNCGSVSAAQSHEISVVVSLRAEPPVPGDLELTDHEPPAARSRRGRDDLPVEHVLQPGRDQRHHQHRRSGSAIVRLADVYLGHPNSRNRFTQRASLSYVTGSHNFKTGFQNERPMTRPLPRERQP